MTDNVVFVSDQRVLVLKRAAALRARSHFESEMKLGAKSGYW